jgi:hypothetical protein
MIRKVILHAGEIYGLYSIEWLKKLFDLSAALDLTISFENRE